MLKKEVEKDEASSIFAAIQFRCPLKVLCLFVK